MPRITLEFALSGPRAQDDLLREFALHDGVDVAAHEAAGRPAIRVQTHDAAMTVWDVRATVRMFDDAAVELGGQA